MNSFYESIKEHPFNPLPYIRLASTYYNQGRYREAKFWLDQGSKIDLDKHTAGVVPMQELKVLYSQLLLKLKYNVD